MNRAHKKRTVTTTMILKGVPVSLRDHFKAWASLRGLSMKEVLIAFMREKITERMNEK